jgi:hypothetical protein
MAASYKLATVVGVDLAFSAVEDGTAPVTCHFESDNVDLGLPHFLEQFFFVHARDLSLGVRINLFCERILTILDFRLPQIYA